MPTIITFRYKLRPSIHLPITCSSLEYSYPANFTCNSDKYVLSK
nr:MAG TPA: hypothetical protein [Caudoviricetes sp.]